MRNSSGKTAIVTGSSRGIGRAIALRLARDGGLVIVTGRDTAALAQTVAQIEQAGGQCTSIALDLRLPEAPQQLVNFALRQAPGIDIVVNNAGATKRGDFMALTDEDWADGFALKFFGAVRLTRAAWPYLKAAQGSLVNIAGAGGRTPGAEFAIGGSVNAAILSFTKAMADVGLADGVQVNAVNPGSVRTERFDKRIATLAKEHSIPPAEAEARFIEAQKVTRIGEPEDIANLVAFIASPAGRFLHGSLIDSDGGATKTI